MDQLIEIQSGMIPYKDLLYNALESFPKNMPMVFLGSSKSDYSFLATNYTPVNNQDQFLDKKLSEFNKKYISGQKYGPGYVGLISYDQGAKADFSNIELYRVEAGLVFQKKDSKVYRFDSGEQAQLNVDWKDLLSFQNQEPLKKIISLISEDHEESYLHNIDQIKNDIASGRYYQLNFIRYFKTNLTQDDSRHLMGRFLELSGPMGAIFESQNVKLISFSPEKLVEFVPEGDHIKAINCPIKGTIERSEDPTEDKKLSDSLLTSDKDLAELHMIVDLIRNDLGKVSLPHTVKVEEKNKLLSFPTVHHLQARVTSLLDSSLSLGEIFRHLTPGGSITGCPKIEVMKAIREYEQRPRGYFMGNCFYISDQGYLNSSILIRSLVAQNRDCFLYAAGSGITFRSDPKAEYLETILKTKVIN